MKRFLVIVFFPAILFMACGCDKIANLSKVSYPEEKLEKCLIEVCKSEYDLDIDVTIVGDTLGIFLAIPNLFDITLSLSENAQEDIQNVLLSASRICLSTDADLKFYCVITQDPKLPEIQLVIIKYTDDVKRVFFGDISRGEYFKRTLIDINENPQARKEQTISEVFSKMKLEEGMKEKILDDFFRSPPSSLEGIGHWNGKFYLKNIDLEEFLAQQIASRVKMRFREKENLRRYTLKLVTGKFVKEKNRKEFLINFSAEGLLFLTDPIERNNVEKEIFSNIFEEADFVVYSYKFKDFDFLSVIENNFNTGLSIPKEEVYLFGKRKMKIEAILDYMHY